MSIKELLSKLQALKLHSKHDIYYKITCNYIIMYVNNKYAIYSDGICFNMKTEKDIPLYIFKLRDKFIKIVGGENE